MKTFLVAVLVALSGCTAASGQESSPQSMSTPVRVDCSETLQVTATFSGARVRDLALSTVAVSHDASHWNEQITTVPIQWEEVEGGAQATADCVNPGFVMFMPLPGATK